MRSPFFATIAVALLCVISSAAAQGAPELISFQGYVTDLGGNPVNNPGVSIRFRFTDGPTQVWSETQPSVKIVNGVFNVLLGSVIPLDTVAFNRPLVLKIKVGTDPEFTPSTPLTSAPYALGMRGLYAVQADRVGRSSYNVIGGASNNVVAAGVVGATIGGGGGISYSNTAPNSVRFRFGTVGGGYSNTAGAEAVVAGGSENKARGPSAAIGGGRGNIANGAAATVPGGLRNSALGSGSFAAGTNARANHDGTFVWADKFDTFFGDSLVSTGENQFLIEAEGGVGINTNQPLNNAKLHVEHGSLGAAEWGFVLSNIFSKTSSTSWRTGMRLTNAGFFEITNKANIPFPNFARLDSGGNWTVISDRRLKTDIEPASDLLKAALELEPVRYYPKSQNQPGGKSLGLIAQQVQEVEPSLVTDGDPLTLNYAGLSVVAIGAIKELYELVQEVRAENEQMLAENEQMLAAMERAGLR